MTHYLHVIHDLCDIKHKVLFTYEIWNMIHDLCDIKHKVLFTYET